MRIALVSANRESLPDAVVPIGLLYLQAAIAEVHECELWDLCFEVDAPGVLGQKLESFAPDVVAVGLRNIQSADYSGCAENLAYYHKLVEVIRERSDATLVLGGSGFSVIPQGLMRALRPDFGISGEGEAAFVRLIDALSHGGDGVERISNLRFFDSGGRIVTIPPRDPYLDLDALATPDRGAVSARYYDDSGIDSIQTKRGCPLRCDYCTYPLIEGRSIRQRDPARVLDEMFLALEAQPAIRHFFIVDSVFNLPPAHAKAVCREMIRRGFRTPWTCYANPIGFDRELADLMAEAGCAGLEIGSDSGVDDVLDRLKKGFHVERIRAIHDHCAAAGIPDCHSFILGTRGESLDDVAKTLDFCAELDPFAALIGIWTDDEEALDVALARQRRALRERVIEIAQRKHAQFPRWIIPSLGVNFDARLFRVLRRKGLKGPLWQHIKLPAPEAFRAGVRARGTEPGLRGGARRGVGCS